MTAQEKWKKIQAVIGTMQDGIPGSKDDSALISLKASGQGISGLQGDSHWLWNQPDRLAWIQGHQRH